MYVNAGLANAACEAKERHIRNKNPYGPSERYSDKTEYDKYFLGARISDNYKRYHEHDAAEEHVPNKDDE